MADDPKPISDAALNPDGYANDTRPIDPKTGKPLAPAQPAIKLTQAPGEEDGPKGPEPTRYGDWERKGIVSDF
ncbi:succinate dehydrogenase assembly factor 4 [Ferrovibrio sp.]|uniref:succinate dehydrogenase assembly factor 4 n=1 Tax=Ferrovibrio sp. TaxID=1917215 RepID=UPI000CB1CD02|nr:succinate dehydrogenase assembly factor 4 [Ferrovibrio sp.]PJI39402.1 MAG: DUF1674 domain-containing protein [Ferrovibrio sp.]